MNTRPVKPRVRPRVAGVDEAGRGPLAGPVVAAAVILDPARPVRGLADSKALEPEERERLAILIRERALCYAVAWADAEEIDSINILQATKLAMSRDWGCWDAEFLAVTRRVREKLMALANCGTSHVCIPLQGCGSIGIEAAILSLVPKDSKLLVPVNGMYSNRIVEICARIGRACVPLAVGEADDHVRDVHLLVGAHRRGVRRSAGRPRAGRGEGARAARLAGQQEDGRAVRRDDCKWLRRAGGWNCRRRL